MLETTPSRFSALQRAMWIMPRTGHAPHSLLTFGDHYRSTVVEFFRACFKDQPARFVVDVDPREPSHVTVRRTGPGDIGRCATHICVVPDKGPLRFFRRWHAGREQHYDLPITEPPRIVTAVRIADVVESEPGSAEEPWQFRESDLMRAGRTWQLLEFDVSQLLDRPADVEFARAIARRIEAARLRDRSIRF